MIGRKTVQVNIKIDTRDLRAKILRATAMVHMALAQRLTMEAQRVEASGPN